MNTLYVVTCTLCGLILSLVLSAVISKPFVTDQKTAKDWLMAVIAICVVIVPAVGFWVIWGSNVVGYAVGVIMTFLPYVKTPADRESEKAEEQEQQ